MNDNFLLYLICIVLGMFIFLALTVMFIIRVRKGFAGERKPQAISCGSVSVFFDEDKNITIIPYVKDKYGTGRATENIRYLNYPYNTEKLGNSVRSAMMSCSGASHCKGNDLMNKLGFSSWKDFSAGKRNISIHYIEGKGIVFNTTTRKSDGSYQFNSLGPEKLLESCVSDNELGQMILELLKRCRV